MKLSLCVVFFGLAYLLACIPIHAVAQTDDATLPPFPPALPWLKEAEPLIDRDTEFVSFLQKNDSIYAMYSVTGGPIRLSGLDPNEVARVGTADILLVRFDAHTQEVRWRFLYDSPEHDLDTPKILESDRQGNLFVGGFTYSEAGWQTGLGPPPNSTLVVVKISPSGKALWTARWKPRSAGIVDSLRGLAVGKTGSVYVVFRLFLAQGRHMDAAILKLNPDGTIAWAKRQVGGAKDSICEPGECVVDDQNNITLCGTFTTFGIDSVNQDHLFLASYAPDGKLRWDHRFSIGTPNVWDGLHLLARDPKDGSLVTAGISGVARFDTNGRTLWKIAATQSFNKQPPRIIRPMRLLISETGNPYILFRAGAENVLQVEEFDQKTGQPVEP